MSPPVRQRFIEQLKAYNYYCPINSTCWAILSEHGAAQVREFLSKVLGPADRLFVVRSGTEAAWRNSQGENHDAWLRKYL
jgi:hypothetical protein